MQKINITVPLYKQKITVIVTENLNKALKKEKIPFNFDANLYGALTYTENTDSIYLFVGKDIDVSLIAHEAVHIVNEIFKRVRIVPDLDSDEPQAYLMGWLVGELNDKLIENKI